MQFALINGRIFDGEQIHQDRALWIRNGRIEALTDPARLPAGIDVVDLGGHLLAPGFIDTQVNGGGGVLFNDSPDVAGIQAIGRAHRRFGTTGFLPTLISDRHDVMHSALEATRVALSSVPGVLGIHLEGPFLNLQRKGIHPAAMIRGPEADALALLRGLQGEGVTLVTLAPEQVSEDFIRELAQAGIVVAAGHTQATYAQMTQALAQGLSGFTHLFNAMSPLTSREPGVVGAALDDDNSWCGLIVDNHHVHAATLRIALRAKAAGKMMLVTDAVQTVGVPGREFELLGQSIVREGGRVASPEGTLAGSDLDMASAVRNCVRLLGLSLEESLRMASLYPAEFLRLGDRYGRVRAGYQASLVLLDEQLQVQQTWIDGVASD
ncbi:N-acetylglucosamine-6-phosphate deacetylase [Marinobacterium rhizophilum]|uniref:N-acetylglucosamine-6-phosphate deacetylase n=1 Tax=Marinobacterium rhizophilum TaxID=420402 RepID=A0ABY5HLK2_9GAMM|nr:N-acetylglucosamine-6-phosphate deacetylase [Marinobacterium rhizophilum]UTW12839.1 N-acetylglucosamine-6-phosphate deacetylase [Marinobacterium rhizophilum]